MVEKIRHLVAVHALQGLQHPGIEIVPGELLRGVKHVVQVQLIRLGGSRQASGQQERDDDGGFHIRSEAPGGFYLGTVNFCVMAFTICDHEAQSVALVPAAMPLA